MAYSGFKLYPIIACVYDKHMGTLVDLAYADLEYDAASRTWMGTGEIKYQRPLDNLKASITNMLYEDETSFDNHTNSGFEIHSGITKSAFYVIKDGPDLASLSDSTGYISLKSYINRNLTPDQFEPEYISFKTPDGYICYNNSLEIIRFTEDEAAGIPAVMNSVYASHSSNTVPTSLSLIKDALCNNVAEDLMLAGQREYIENHSSSYEYIPLLQGDIIIPANIPNVLLLESDSKEASVTILGNIPGITTICSDTLTNVTFCADAAVVDIMGSKGLAHRIAMNAKAPLQKHASYYGSKELKLSPPKHACYFSIENALYHYDFGYSDINVDVFNFVTRCNNLLKGNNFEAFAVNIAASDCEYFKLQYNDACVEKLAKYSFTDVAFADMLMSEVTMLDVNLSENTHADVHTRRSSATCDSLLINAIASLVDYSKDPVITTGALINRRIDIYDVSCKDCKLISTIDGIFDRDFTLEIYLHNSSISGTLSLHAMPSKNCKLFLKNTRIAEIENVDNIEVINQ